MAFCYKRKNGKHGDADLFYKVLGRNKDIPKQPYGKAMLGRHVPVKTHSYGRELNCEIHSCIFICAIPYLNGVNLTVTFTFPLAGIIPEGKEMRQHNSFSCEVPSKRLTHKHTPPLVSPSISITLI